MTDEQKGQEVIEEVVPASQPEGELPEEASERTRKEFEKLKAHNKELQEKLKQQTPEKPSIMEEMYPRETQTPPRIDASQFPGLTQQQVNQVQEELTYVGEDGYKYIDPNKLQRSLKEADERARRAEEATKQVSEQIRRYEETQQVKEAYKDFPELNPNSESFDPNFYELVKGELLNQTITRGQRDLVKASRTIKERLSSYSQGSQKQEKQKEEQVKKEQINATGFSQSRTSHTASGFDDLVAGTRYGKPGALAERLRRSGY